MSDMIDVNVVYSFPVSFDTDGNIMHIDNNLRDYDIHPPYSPLTTLKNLPIIVDNTTKNDILDLLGILNGQRFDHNIRTDYVTFNNYTLDDIKKTNKPFIYPLMLYNNDIFNKYTSIELPEYVVKSCRNYKAKICFFQPTEGFFGIQDSDFVWVSRLSKKLNIPRETLVFITANMDSPRKYNDMVNRGVINNNFTVCAYSHFGDNLWFKKQGSVTFKSNASILRNLFDINLSNRKTTIPKYHFLSFNRVPKIHRVLIYGTLASNSNFENKYIASLGGMNIFNQTRDEDKLYYSDWIHQYIDETYKHGFDDLLNFYNNYDSRENTFYDEPDLENNKASNLNEAAHIDSFVNIVTESLIEHDCVFFSEKTFKPIFMAQPFIIFGNPYSLKKLRDMGYKTFGQWWDESYDIEYNIQTRYEKIVDIMLEISSWDLKKCNHVIHEMEDILVHNFNVMIEGRTTRDVINTISDFSKYSKSWI